MTYEAHITIEPVFDEALSAVGVLALQHGFTVSKLFMQKRKEDTPERSKYDSFLTVWTP